MNSTELVTRIAETTGLPKSKVKAVLDSLVDTTARALKKHEDVKVNGLGTFKAKHRAARTGRNPQTGGTMKVAAKWTVTCTVSKALKDQV